LVFRQIAAELDLEELFALGGEIGDCSMSPTARYDADYRADDARVQLWKEYLQEAEGASHSESRRLLDVGSSRGIFLDIARKSGWDVMGIEPSASEARYATENFDLLTYIGTLEEASLPGNDFDVVTLWDVIEHLKDPSATMAEVFRVLRPGGMTFVLTPNHDSLITLLLRIAYRLTAHRLPLERLLYPPVHLYYFTPRTLSDLLRRAGFEIKRVCNAPLHPEKCLLTSSIMRFGASLVDSVGQLIGRPYRVMLIASKPRGQEMTP